MRLSNIVCKESTLGLTLIVAVFLQSLSGCKKDSGPTGPFYPPALPTVAGHWTGTGSAFDMGMARRLNFTWVADFGTTHTDNSFVGTMTSTWIDPNIYYTGDQWQSGVKGNFTASLQVTIAETSAVYTHRGLSSPITDARLFTAYAGCTLSLNGDTLFYSGPGPALETYVLIKKK